MVCVKIEVPANCGSPFGLGSVQNSYTHVRGLPGIPYTKASWLSCFEVDGENLFSDQLICRSNWMPVRDSMVAFSVTRGGDFLIVAETRRATFLLLSRAGTSTKKNTNISLVHPGGSHKLPFLALLHPSGSGVAATPGGSLTTVGYVV